MNTASVTALRNRLLGVHFHVVTLNEDFTYK